MANISIKINGSWVQLPNGRYTLGQAEEHRNYTMANGRIKTVLTGVRKTITASLDYIPDDILSAINAAINADPVVDVKYYDIDGTEKTGVFICEAISPKIFKYITVNSSTVPVWTDITITLKGQVIS